MPFGANDVSRKLSKLVCNIETLLRKDAALLTLRHTVHLTAHPTDKSHIIKQPLCGQTHEWVFLGSEITLTSLPPCGSAAVLTRCNRHVGRHLASARCLLRLILRKNINCCTVEVSLFTAHHVVVFIAALKTLR